MHLFERHFTSTRLITVCSMEFHRGGYDVTAIAAYSERGNSLLADAYSTNAFRGFGSYTDAEIEETDAFLRHSRERKSTTAASTTAPRLPGTSLPTRSHTFRTGSVTTGVPTGVSAGASVGVAPTPYAYRLGFGPPPSGVCGIRAPAGRARRPACPRLGLAAAAAVVPAVPVRPSPRP